PLVLDYGTDVVNAWTEVWWEGLVVLALLGATAWALWRRPVLGFLGAWFFVILAPSSSVVPLVTQTMAEHRMYLPLAAVLALVVLGARRVTGRNNLATLLVLAVAAGAAAWQRNEVYQDSKAIWQDTIAKVPQCARAHNNL